MKVKMYCAKVGYTDADGYHPKGSKIEVPYETAAQVASAASMVSYGVLGIESDAEPSEVKTEKKGRLRG